METVHDRKPPKKFVAEPFEYHQEITLQIDTLSNLGDGVGRVDDWVVFVPFALPGETVKAKVWKNDKNCSFADLIEVITPSEHRVDPRCSLFGQCGGCQYQHLGYSEQLRWKQKHVSELLQKLSEIDFSVNDPIPSPIEWNYRSKITPHFQKPRNGEINAIGFLQKGARQKIIDVPQCDLALDSINEILPEVRKETHLKTKQYKKGATLLLRANKEQVYRDPREIMSEKVGNLTFRFLAGDFFQNNPAILEEFVSYAAKQALVGSKYLVDAYCGSGLFGLSLAEHFEKVAMVEVSETGADWARYNARSNGIDNAEILTASAEDIFEKISFPSNDTTILIDPPRKGCNEEFLNQLFSFRPQRVVYISCNPSTQARDLKFFNEANYKVIDVQPIDLFPQTKHLECIVTLDNLD